MGFIIQTTPFPMLPSQSHQTVVLRQFLEAAIGNGALSNTSSNKNSDKQAEVKESIENYYGSYTRQAYQIVYGANYYSDDIYNSAICVTSINIDYVMNYLRNSLKNSVVPIVNLNDTLILNIINKQIICTLCCNFSN